MIETVNHIPPIARRIAARFPLIVADELGGIAWEALQATRPRLEEGTARFSAYFAKSFERELTRISADRDPELKMARLGRRRAGERRPKRPVETVNRIFLDWASFIFEEVRPRLDDEVVRFCLLRAQGYNLGEIARMLGLSHKRLQGYYGCGLSRIVARETRLWVAQLPDAGRIALVNQMTLDGLSNEQVDHLMGLREISRNPK